MRPTTTIRRAAAVLTAASFLMIATAPAGTQVRKGPDQFPSGTVVARRLSSGGLERSVDGGSTWEPVSGMPTRVLPASRAGEPLPITAFTTPSPSPADPAGRAVIAASPGVKRPGYHLVSGAAPALAGVGGRLLVSRDGLVSWQPVDLDGVINASSYVTALAVDPRDNDHWLLGTSYDGLYRTTDAGATWTDLTANRSDWPSYLGSGFFEEVAAIWFTAYDYAIVQLGFGQGFLRVELDPLSVTRLGPAAAGPDSYELIGTALVSGGRDAADESASEGATTAAARAAARRAVAADQTGIYLAPQNATMDRFPDYLNYLEQHGFTSVVVDFKDDLGRLTYASHLETVRAAGAVTPIIDPRALVEAAHARDVYVIARVVVFKDPKLWAYDDHRYAIWDVRRDAPWGVFRTYTNEETGAQRTVQVEQWVDAYAPEVWQYNVDIVREIAAFGVDEIQLDYIRFPSDGVVEDIGNRFYVEGADRVQALEGFLSAVRDAVDLPMSIDVFGFNAWARMSYLGQDITRLARYVDVISPMFYPSHFARPFLPQFDYLERAAVIYDLGTRRAREMTNTYGATLIRPYIQAFLIGAELEFETPTYRRYLDLQVEASERAHSSGYTLWNASGRYYMLP